MWVVVEKLYVEDVFCSSCEETIKEGEFKGFEKLHFATRDKTVAEAVVARMRGNYQAVEVPVILQMHIKVLMQ